MIYNLLFYVTLDNRAIGTIRDLIFCIFISTFICQNIMTKQKLEKSHCEKIN